jgi:hypothetical protein
MRCRRGMTKTLLVLACLIMISVVGHGRDDNQRLERHISCHEANVAPGTVPGNRCLEGQYCTVCEYDFNFFGDHVTPHGHTSMPMWNPFTEPCSGDRLVGICVSTGGIDSCDLSQATLAGSCTQSTQRYDQQPQSGGGGDP